MLETFLVVPAQKDATDEWWVLRCLMLQMLSTAPTTKNILAPNFITANVEKLRMTHYLCLQYRVLSWGSYLVFVEPVGAAWILDGCIPCGCVD